MARANGEWPISVEVPPSHRGDESIGLFSLLGVGTKRTRVA